MTASHLAQLAAAVLSAATPWIVVRIALGVASHVSRTVQQPLSPPDSVGRLTRATAAALPIVAAIALWLPAQSPWMAGVDAIAFIALGTLAVRALGDIDAVSRAAREVPAVVRTAHLSPRRVSHYLPWPWRWLPYASVAIGLALLGWRLTEPLAHRRPLVPLVLALAASVFLWLYEVWIANVVTGPVIAEGDDGQPRFAPSVRMLFTIELALITGLLSLAHLLLNLDWNAQGPWAAAAALAGALLGVVGCALALSSDLYRRRYVPARS